MNETVITHSGLQFECNYLATIPVPSRMYIRIGNSTIANIASVFSDPHETDLIKYGDTVIEGYTQLIAIIPENDVIRVVLAKS